MVIAQQFLQALMISLSHYCIQMLIAPICQIPQHLL
jgi:hypothetical protein